MKKFLISSILIVLMLTVLSVFERVYAGDDCITYSTTVINESLTANTAIDISSTISKVRISRVVISISSGSFAPTLTAYDNNQGGTLAISTTNATIMWTVDLPVSGTSSTVCTYEFTDSNLLIAHYGLRLRLTAGLGATVKFNMLYR